ncbi:hypothetical protein TNCT_613471 [Trichonephila clavata]|uniref:Uncharacterized protein n=1 Tax=Trichonephila clavata TaxID=2740835 RepID=A0A8X6FPA8_TRICU|nr:hypothetical protein TNCT_613471 [Trichonephila clavata]
MRQEANPASQRPFVNCWTDVFWICDSDGPHAEPVIQGQVRHPGVFSESQVRGPLARLQMRRLRSRDRTLLHGRQRLRGIHADPG